MPQKKRELIKINLTKINNFLKENPDSKKQALIHVLENPEAIIPQVFDDAAFNQTREILKIIVPKYMVFEGETPEKQAKLARKFIQGCMIYLLNTPDATHHTLFNKLPEEGLSDLIAAYANTPRVTEVSKRTHGFFKQTIELQELLHAAVWSDAEEKAPNKVADILEDHPELLFKKGQITKEGIKTSKMYRFELMPERSELEELKLKGNVIYISAINNKISYTMITPSRIKIENKLTNIDAPTPLTLTDELKQAVLDETVKEGYTPILYEQTYYDLSPFQWILFSGDTYLLEKIKPFITEADRVEAKKQSNELAGGGSDLVKLDVIEVGDRIKDMSELSYEELTQFVDTNEGGQPELEETENKLKKSMAWSLQENEDAIFLYHNDYYYVHLNHEIKAVEKITRITLATQSAAEQNKLDALFTCMEMNSARRSNDREHELVETATKSAFNPTGINLKRKGIRYKRGDDYYQDCKAESLIVRALRRYIQLWDGALDEDQNATREARMNAWSKVDDAWLDVGKAQATDTADKLLLYCMKNMPLNLVSEFKMKFGAAIQNLKREFKFNSSINERYRVDVGVYSGRDSCIGESFSLLKGWRSAAGSECPHLGGTSVGEMLSLDLAAFRRYDEMKRADVDEFMKSLDLPIRNHGMKH